MGAKSNSQVPGLVEYANVSVINLDKTVAKLDLGRKVTSVLNI
jgi:hypothetical protein